jgi:hypothetical protein
MALEVRRIVTGHDSQGKAVVATDERLAGTGAAGTAPLRRPHGSHSAKGTHPSRAGTSGSNPVSSSSQSVSAVNPEAIGERPRTLAAVCGWLGT